MTNSPAATSLETLARRPRPLVYTKAQLLDVLGYSERRFDEIRPKLESQGFPKPVPGMGARWSILAVEQYINGAPCLAPQAGTAAGATAAVPADAVEEARASLERRYGGQQ